MGQLKEQMKRDLKIKGFSPKTQDTYLRHIVHYVKYFKRSPEELGQTEIKDYLHYLIAERNLSSAYVNGAYSALKFLYETTLGREWEMNKIPRAKKEKKLPVVLSPSEVKRIFDVTVNIKHKAILMTIYGAGLRVSEAANLKISDIDSSNMQIYIKQGKGKKDRYCMLSPMILNILRKYYELYHPSEWLFQGSLHNKPITTRTIERVFEISKEKAGIRKTDLIPRYYIPPDKCNMTA